MEWRPLQLFALACNLQNSLRRLALPSVSIAIAGVRPITCGTAPAQTEKRGGGGTGGSNASVLGLER